jgi:tripartite-type tricarboxylate transporter receptor subunit TctC
MRPANPADADTPWAGCRPSARLRVAVRLNRVSCHLFFAPVAAVVLAVSANAIAQGFPTRAVTLVVPFAVGGSNDAAARALASQLTAQWSQPVLVENHPGAGGLIGTNKVINGGSDGYQILLNNPSLLLLSHLHNNVDPMQSLRPVANVVNTPSSVVVSGKLPITNFAQLFAYCKQSATPCTVGIADPLARLTVRNLLESNGVANGIIVNYKGTAPMLVDLFSNQINLGVTTVSGPLPHHRSGMVRIIGVGTPAGRLSELPEVATYSEQGFKHVLPAVWAGVFVHKDVPQATVDRIAQGIATATTQEAFRKLVATMGSIPGTEGNVAFTQQIARQKIAMEEMLKRFPIRE